MTTFLRGSSGLIAFIILGASLPAVPARAQACRLYWDAQIGLPGLSGPPPNSKTGRAMLAWDDGTGEALFVGGLFDYAGNTLVDGIAKWNGQSFDAVGGGMASSRGVYALAVFDDGTGPALYAGGKFTLAGGLPASRVAKWDGSSWSALGDGVLWQFRASETIVFALAVYDDGTGPALYAAGRFTLAGGQSVRHIARWDGQEWSDVGGGLDGMLAFDRVNALCTYDDGNGAQLYVGGMFTGAGGVASPGIVRWNGAEWSDVAGGVSDGSPYVRALAVYDEGRGPALFVGGEFANAGGVPARAVAKWDGQGWHPLGDGFSDLQWVTSFAAHDDGTGPALYAGGKFTFSGNTAINRVAKWNGSRWLPVGAGPNDNVYALASWDDGSGPALYACGRFTEVANRPAVRIARWRCRTPQLSGPASLPLVQGDMNCDGAVNGADIDPFTLALGEPTVYGIAFPNCHISNGDINKDGFVNGSDIDPFFECLAAGGCP